jgi:hypothetical protein
LLGGEAGLGLGFLPGLPVGFELASGFGVFGGALFGLPGGLGGFLGAAGELGFEFGAQGLGFGHFLFGGEAGGLFGFLAGLPVGFELSAGLGVFGGALFGLSGCFGGLGGLAFEFGLEFGA